MKFISIVGIFLIIAVIVLLEWPRVKSWEKRGRNTFIVLLTLSCILGILLVFFPDMPGPTEFIHDVYRPLTNILEK